MRTREARATNRNMPPATPKAPADASPSTPTAVEVATFDAVAPDVPGPSASEHGAQEAAAQPLDMAHGGLQLSSVNGKTPIDELMRAHQKPIESVAELKALLDRLPPGAEANFGVVHDEDSEQEGPHLACCAGCS